MIKQYFKKLTIVFILLLGNYYSKATVFNIYIDPILGYSTDINGAPLSQIYGNPTDTVIFHYVSNMLTVNSSFENTTIYGLNNLTVHSINSTNLTYTTTIANATNYTGLGNYDFIFFSVYAIPDINDPFGMPIVITGGSFQLNVSPPSFALPLTWKSFKAELSDYNTTDLTWITSSEKNTLIFEVEKSIDAKNWTVINQQNAAGNSETEKTYNAIDTEVAIGTTYYRIKQIDMDNKYTYSSVQKVVRINLSDILIYPNPVKTSLNISFNNAVENTLIEIYSLEGRKIMSEKTNNLNLTINLENLAKGTYMIRISSTEKTYTSKFVRQ